MLTKCPECELTVSDKAETCPHCGYPLKTKTQKRKYNKRKRLPNGFGQITEIHNKNLRKPFRAMVTVSKDQYGRPICRMLKPEAYFETYNDAYNALVEYNRNPYDLDDAITVEQLYFKWSEEYFKTLKSDSSIRTIKAAWNRCSDLYRMRAKDVRVRHIKGIMEKCDSENIRSRIKSVFNLMYDYALEYELVDHNYARDFNANIIESPVKQHIAFTEEELKVLWDNAETVPYVDIILIQCYMGWRPQELITLEKKNIDWDNMTITGGMKTEAGTDRIVPVHTSLYKLIRRLYANNGERIVTCMDSNNSTMTYDKYRHRFDSVVKQLGLNPEHRAHDPRKTFITLCKKYNVDEYAIKYMAGHAITDITEKVYTERDIEWLRSEIEKIKY